MMKKHKGIFRGALIPVTAALLGSLILTAQGVGQQGTPVGEQLFRGYCAVCHGEQGDGRGVAAPSFGGKIADFTNPEFWKKIDDRKIVNVILKGQGRMPAQALSTEEAKAVVEYMKSAFKAKYGS
jgi:mono/diheme cytochrome c family protein